MITRQCQKCGADFKTHPSKIKMGWGKFCSRTCGYEFHGRKEHGGVGTRLYKIWVTMKGRCAHKGSEYYSKVGVSVCEEWKSAFEPFRKWSLENGYQDDLTIDRIDGNGNYEPSNCRWVTKKQQSMNTIKRIARTSKFKGVSWFPRDSKWRASIFFEGKQVHIGLFVSEADAALAYDKKSLELFGQFGRRNFMENSNDDSCTARTATEENTACTAATA